MGMVIATIVRRTLIAKDESLSGFFLPPYGKEFDLQEKTFFKILQALDEGLSNSEGEGSVTKWLLARSTLMENLSAAVLGNYQVIADLLRVLDEGNACKYLVDTIIDKCEAVINIREAILTLRIQVTSDDANLMQALSYLERYFCLITFASYMNEQLENNLQIDFSRWMRTRPEILSMLKKLRSKRSNMLLCFRPLEDLTEFDPNLIKDKPIMSQMERFVIKNRSGAVLSAHSILKLDHWGEEHVMTRDIEGAPNFRKVETQHIYGTAQPTLQGIRDVLDAILGSVSSQTHVHWINLREEPLIYINGRPFVLRDEYATLRNIRTHAGIGAERIRLMEIKLKEDVLAETQGHHGKILLHEETAGGLVTPVWENVTPEDVKTFDEIINLLKTQGYRILYSRIAITAEESPEDDDFDQILHSMLTDATIEVSYVFNCQMGLGRSTLGTVTAYLVRNWLKTYEPGSLELVKHLSKNQTDTSISEKRMFFEDEPKKIDSILHESIDESFSFLNNHQTDSSMQDSEGISQLSKWLPSSKSHEDIYRSGDIVSPATNQYWIVLSLLRILRNGLECKYQVDTAVYKCDKVLNLIESIEIYRNRAEQAEDESEKDLCIRKGLMCLKRYFCLILFQSYLLQITPLMVATSGPSFKIWKSRHHELAGMFEQLSQADISALMPIHQLYPGEGFAHANEVVSALSQRRGSILASNTILKSDHFPGSQKASLMDKIADAPNFRMVTVKLRTHKPAISQMVYKIGGTGMPTKTAIREILKRFNISPKSDRQLLWICLREEPVVFVNDKPYVLRNFQEPQRNLESTGIAKERLETMETRMKKDIIAEAERNGGLVLLHTEEMIPSEQKESSSQYRFVPVWEAVDTNEAIETIKEVFHEIRLEGFPVTYFRIPITDEQAPIPEVFDEIFRHLCRVHPDNDVLFNCQMGRGRTTTGMVIAYLIELIRLDLPIEATAPHKIEAHPSKSEEEQSLLNGEYRLVRQVVGILQNGKRSKGLVDTAINQCDHIQNLREAIYLYRSQIAQIKDSVSQSQRKNLTTWAIHYLYRYCYLILFADYLLERRHRDPYLQTSDPMEVSQDKLRDSSDRLAQDSFKSWLAERQEIASLFEEAYRDFVV